MRHLPCLLLCLFLTGCGAPAEVRAPQASAEEPRTSKQAPQKIDKATKLDWTVPEAPEETSTIPLDFELTSTGPLPKSQDPQFCSQRVRHAPSTSSCDQGVAEQLKAVLLASPVWTQTITQCDRINALLDSEKQKRLGSESIQNRESTAHFMRNEPMSEKEQELLQLAQRDIVVHDTSRRERTSLADRESRDSQLAELEGCSELPVGYLENLRAELLPECTETFAAKLSKDKIKGAQAAEMQARLVATRLQRWSPQVNPVPSWLAGDEFKRRFTRDLVPQLEGVAQKLDSFRVIVAELPAGPGKANALGALHMLAFKLLDGSLIRIVTKGAEKDYEVRTFAYSSLESLRVADGVTLFDFAKSLRSEWLLALAHEGSLHSESAHSARARGQLRIRNLLRNSVALPWCNGESLVEALPLPHFYAPFADGSRLETLWLARGGYSPNQLRAALAQLKFAPQDQELRRALGEHFLAKALLFESRADAENAVQLLAPIVESDAQRADLALAQGIAAQEHEDLAAFDSSRIPTLRLSDATSQTRLDLNRASPEMIMAVVQNGLSHLRPQEVACFNDRLDYNRCATQCMPHSWVWPASAGKPVRSQKEEALP